MAKGKHADQVRRRLEGEAAYALDDARAAETLARAEVATLRRALDATSAECALLRRRLADIETRGLPQIATLQADLAESKRNADALRRAVEGFGERWVKVVEFLMGEPGYSGLERVLEILTGHHAVITEGTLEKIKDVQWVLAMQRGQRRRRDAYADATTAITLDDAAGAATA